MGAPLSTVSYFNNEVNLFCAGHVFLPNGDLFVVGGQNACLLLWNCRCDDLLGTKGGWSQPANGRMATARWYPSVANLASGDVLALGGSITPTSHSKIPEVWQTDKGLWRKLTGASLQVKIYSWAFQAPDGRVFVAGPAQQTRYPRHDRQRQMDDGQKSLFGERTRGTAVVYDDGKILISGGANPATNTAETIDLIASPTWKSTASMAYARRMHNLTVLPDGTVLATGGGASGNIKSNAVMPAEIWDPKTGLWTTVASMTQPRLYHSTAVLLPDGRVLTAGTGRPAPKGGTDVLNAEIYSPPYLFKGGTRPALTSAPAAVGYGETFFVGTPDGATIEKATLIKLSSTTHGLNMGQRLTRVTSISQAAGGLNLGAPTNRNLAPPGHYHPVPARRPGRAIDREDHPDRLRSRHNPVGRPRRRV